MGVAFAASVWAVFQGASEAAIPAAVLPERATPKDGPNTCSPRVALKKGRGLRWLLSYSPMTGCAFEAALPSAFFECNKGYPHLISGSLGASTHLKCLDRVAN